MNSNVERALPDAAAFIRAMGRMAGHSGKGASRPENTRGLCPAATDIV
jgi:hypothetical protein